MHFHNFFFTVNTSVLCKYVPMMLLHSVVSTGQECVYKKKTKNPQKETMYFKENKNGLLFLTFRGV